MRSSGSLFKAIAIAIFLVFVVMAAQFESTKFSLMVMTTIPFSLIGSFGLLAAMDVEIPMPSLLGFLMLIGTVVNAGILYVDTVNQYRSTMDKRTAMIEAGATRLRPILMTTLTTIVSMIPLAIGYGKEWRTDAGACPCQCRRPDGFHCPFAPDASGLLLNYERKSRYHTDA